MTPIYRTKEVENMLQDLKSLAEDGFYVDEIAEQMGFTYAKTQYYLSKFNITHRKKKQVAREALPHYIHSFRWMIKRTHTVPDLKKAYDYIQKNVPKKEQDDLIDLLLDKQHEIRTEYEKSLKQKT